MSKPKITGKKKAVDDLAPTEAAPEELKPGDVINLSPADEPSGGNGAPDAQPESFAKLSLAYDEQGFPCLSIAQLAAFNESILLDDNSKLRLELSKVKRQLWLEQQAPYRKMTDDINAATVEREGKQRAYRETMRRLSQEIGAQLEGCIINDQTGRITFVDTRDRPIVGAQKPPDHARLREET